MHLSHAILLRLVLWIWQPHDTRQCADLETAFSHPECANLIKQVGRGEEVTQETIQSLLVSGKMKNNVTIMSLPKRMIEFGPAIARAWAIHELPIPIDWIFPNTGSNREGLFAIVASLVAMLPADQAQKAGNKDLMADRADFLFDTVTYVFAKMEDGWFNAMKACKCQWGVVGNTRKVLAERVARVLLLTCPNHPVFRHAYAGSIPNAQWDKVKMLKRLRAQPVLPEAQPVLPEEQPVLPTAPASPPPQ